MQKTRQEPTNRRIVGTAFAIAAAVATLGLGLRFVGGELGLLPGLRGLALIGLFCIEAIRRLLLHGVAAERAGLLSALLGASWVALFLLDGF